MQVIHSWCEGCRQRCSAVGERGGRGADWGHYLIAPRPLNDLLWSRHGALRPCRYSGRVSLVRLRWVLTFILRLRAPSISRRHGRRATRRHFRPSPNKLVIASKLSVAHSEQWSCPKLKRREIDRVSAQLANECSQPRLPCIEWEKDINALQSEPFKDTSTTRYRWQVSSLNQVCRALCSE